MSLITSNSVFSMKGVSSTFLVLLIWTSNSKAQFVRNSTGSAAGIPQDSLDVLLNAPKFSSESTKTILLFSMVFVAMLSIVTNSLVIHVVKVNRHMRSTTNYFIVNMAVANLISTVLVVSVAIKLNHSGLQWSTGAIGVITCKGILYFTVTSFLCSVYSLVSITFDRFMAVSRPLTHKYHSRWTKYILPVVWITSLAIPSNVAWSKMNPRQDFLPNDNQTYCFIKDATHDNIALIVLGYFVPHAVMVILYVMIGYKLCTRRVPGDQRDEQRRNVAQQTAKKVILMIVCILTVFEICMATTFTVFFTPYAFIEVRSIYNSYFPSLFSLISNSNGILNTLIYASFNENYRRAFADALGLRRIIDWYRTTRMPKIARNAAVPEGNTNPLSLKKLDKTGVGATTETLTAI